MFSSIKAHSALAILFLALLFCASIANLYHSGPALADGIAAAPTRRPLAALAHDVVLGKHQAWALYARIQDSLGKKEMNNFSVIKAADGRLYRGALFPVRTEEAENLALDIAALADIAESSGARLAFLGMPGTVLLGAENLPRGMPFVDCNEVLNSALYTLREKNVPFFDARYAFLVNRFPSEKIAPKSAFLLSGDAAFALFTYTVEYLQQRFSLSLDPDGFFRNRENYQFTRLPQFFIGQMGKETGPAFSRLDDFTAVTPTFESAFAIQGVDMFGNVIEKQGDAQATLLHPDALEYYADLYSLYPEAYYIHANAAWTRIVNLDNPDGLKVLFVHDFYSAQLISHLAPLFGELHTLASQENQPYNALEYMQENEFDLVLISFFPQNLILPQTRALLGDLAPTEE